MLMLKQEFGWKIPYYVKQNIAKKGQQKKYVSKEAIAVGVPAKVIKYKNADHSQILTASL